jgi:penicillin-binding protein 2
MARFYSALTSDDGFDSKPELVRTKPERSKLINLTSAQLDSLRVAMVGVTSTGGTAASAALSGGVELAGKTGTAQTTSMDRGGKTCDHAWFVGFAPAEKPKILVSVMIECGGHGYNAARVASAIVAKYLGVTSLYLGTTEGNN